MRRATVRNFVPAHLPIRACNTGHVSNGHWAVLKDMMPKGFQDYIALRLLSELEEDLQSILDKMEDETFVEVFPVEEGDLEDENLETVIFQPREGSFQIGFNPLYVLYLKKIKNLRFFASPRWTDVPARLIVKGLIDREIGLLMGKG